MPHFFRRVLETLGFEVLSSFALASLFYFGILQQTQIICIIFTLLCFIINIAVLDIFLNGFLLSGYSGIEYYLTNFVVLAILAILGIAFAAFNIEPAFTLLFLPFKLFHFILGISKVASAIIVSASFFITAIVKHSIYKCFALE